MSEKIVVSALPKTWILDLDGTILRHNGYLTAEGDTILPGVEHLFSLVRPEDMVIFITSRLQDSRDATEHFLKSHGIRYDAIFYGAPYGERILINDKKPSGLITAIAVNTERNQAIDLTLEIDSLL